VLGEFDDAMGHGMPTYSRDGVAETAFARQQRYISHYELGTDVMARHRHEVPPGTEKEVRALRLAIADRLVRGQGAARG
jgi:hypothetical protein